MKKIITLAVLFLSSILFIFACGGGGGAASPASVVKSYTTFQAASVVIGQPAFTSNGSNQYGSVNPKTLYQPGGKSAVINGALYLPDTQNNRILGFNSVPGVNNPSADFVLGQTSLNSASRGVTSTTMDVPLSVTSSNGKLFAAEAGNNRVLVWNTVPTASTVAADIVVGQPGFGTVVPACTRTGMNTPTDVVSAGGKLIVVDSSNHRVLIWNSVPFASGAPADVVLGQGNFTRCQYNDDDQNGTADAAPSDRTLYYPNGVWSDGSRLMITDSGNNRLLIWNSIPTANFTPADLVLGQGDFVHNAANDDSQTGTDKALPTARTFSCPSHVDSDGTLLVVSDNTNNRVLIWNSIPEASFTPADIVLGQGDFIHNAANDDTQAGTSKPFPTARTLQSPQGVRISGSRLFVGDTNNSRYLIFETH